jgi:hypothetical protein
MRRTILRTLGNSKRLINKGERSLMRHRDKLLRLLDTNPLASHLAAADLRFEASTPRLTHRSIKISELRETEVIERKAGVDRTPLFVSPPKPAETVKKWASECTLEVEENFE